MWSFIKNVFAIVIGLFVFTILSIIGIVFLVLISSGEEETIKSQSVLKLKLNKEIVERESEKLFSEGSLLPAGSVIGLLDLKEAIAEAKKDDKIKGIYLELSSIQSGFASLEEIRNSLLDFKRSGKFIVAYAESYTEGAYYIASVADKIFLPSSGSLEFNGLESEQLFFKGTLEKLDIKVEVFKVGSFKSAVEPFLLDKMSDSNRVQVKSFMNSIYDTYLTNVAMSRKLDVKKLKLISDSMLVRNAQDALAYGLITDLAYYDKVEEYIHSKTGQEKETKLKFISYSSLLNHKEAEKNETENKVAVIIANGEIISGRGNDEIIGSETLALQIRKAREDKKVKAIVLRVNSPGGSALASDLIWNEVILTKGVKPIIASMSDVAASGGYYISMACDTIVAQPNTITGSIGVFGLLLNAEAFLKEKLGVTTDRVKTGEFSDVGSATRTMTNYERKIIQQEVEKIYEEFTSKAAQGRNMPQEELKRYAQGRVWSGSEALKIKLVDTLGGIDQAIKIAALKAKLEDYETVYWPEQKNIFWKQLLTGMSDGETDTESMLKKELGFVYPYLHSVKELNKLNGVQARMPFKLIIK
ncbi:MAG TPA: signal peptide peptidase SppA [Cytophagaceae bacterium]|jgi:protease-4|nr:signal peptide peptidase SppA [Cytophagaceae bacterium]